MRRHRDRGAQDDSGEPVAADGRPEQRRSRTPSGVRWRISPSAVSRSIDRTWLPKLPAAVVVLAVDVAGDRAADGDLPGAGQHRHPQAERQCGPHQRVEVHAGVDVDEVAVAVDRVDLVQRGHVDDQPAAVLGVVAVGPAQPPGDDAAGAAVGGLRRPPWRSAPGRGSTAPEPPTGRCGPSRSRRRVVVGNIVTRVPCGSRGSLSSRKITDRCTTKLMTVAVPWAMTNATGTRHGWFSNCM